MPTVLRIFGWRVVIYPNDHRPPHVHVMGGGCESVWNLVCPRGTVTLRENYGFSRADLARTAKQLQKHLRLLCDEWERIHGE